MPTLLYPDQWRAREHAHAERARAYTEPFRQRRARQQTHPVYDFLFTYYSFPPAQLERWHPGPGVVLLGDDAVAQRSGWRFYSVVEDAGGSGRPGVTVDTAEFVAARGRMLDFADTIFSAVAARPGSFSCFGLHEWAMAYKSDENGVRHDYVPLRLGSSGTDEVVETHQIRCTHFDAFRFYAPQARGLNQLMPTRERQVELEQPGCLHAGMDVYKWLYKLAPLVDSGLIMDAFELAWETRIMDMQASPYDLSEWGFEPIRIETAHGKAEYVERQRAFSERSQRLRQRGLDAVAAIRASAAV
ncbi:3-methyladenine DNA glycosylase [Arthrobacter sp. HMSC06H05]|uniref:3-methyladenine DNA glycosylase n=1 Tax=Arthrobacter sp. HMSC06H05 TaxID=1581128 RepID=UPI0008A399D8|nr:3-methyladenine DNA glycosylase [Arthrobacter sp. HMSC06H05]OFT43709.1 3-methyladenine DNA glycosylase [Arthrobacter sp. HMSC06H05]